MTTETKKTLQVSFLLFTVLGFAGYWAATRSKEHRDYVKAAANYDEVVRETQRRYGVLDFNGWRDVEDRWIMSGYNQLHTIYENIPEEAGIHDHTGHNHTDAEIFADAKEWLEYTAHWATEIHITHYGEVPSDDSYFYALRWYRHIIPALANTLRGAVEAKDVAGIEQHFEIVWHLLRGMQNEAAVGSWMHLEVTNEHFLITAMTLAVENRNNRAVFEALKNGIDGFHRTMTIQEAFGSTVRELNEFLYDASRFEGEKFDEWIESLGGAYQEHIEDGVPNTQFAQSMRSVFGKDKPSRNAGESGIKAVTTRIYEVMIAADLSDDAVSKGQIWDRSYIDTIKQKTLEDRSYEIVSLMMTPLFDRFDYDYNTARFLGQALPLALEIVEENRRQSSLPDSIEASRLFADPFGGEPIKYYKTNAGFALVSASEDRMYHDRYEKDGFAPFETKTMFMRGTNLRLQDDLVLSIKY